MFSRNIQSIRATFDDLKLFLEHLRTLIFEISAICLQECTFSDGDNLRWPASILSHPWITCQDNLAWSPF